MDYFECIPLKEAKRLIVKEITSLNAVTQEVVLAESLGRIIAQDIISQEDLPPFSRSTVDGFAVHSRDTFGAGEGVPALLTVVGEVAMGEKNTIELHPGQAVVVPTGGMLPVGADAMVMLEHAERPDNTTLLVLRAVAPGENVVGKGEDIRIGQYILYQGNQILPQDIGAMAACGIESVPVRSKPTIVIISTGDEVVDVGSNPVGGQIRDINSYALSAQLEEAGCTVKRYGIVRDNYDDLLKALSQSTAHADMVIVSGGSSVGARDYTVRAIEKLGKAKVIFHGVAIKPGKPTIFGKIGNVPVFGLPGHPVAAMTVCSQLVKPAIRVFLGQTVDDVYTIPARMLRSMASVPGRDDYIRVRLIKIQDEYWAEPVLGKSGLISTMSAANGIVHIPADKNGLYSEELVQVEVFKQ